MKYIAISVATAVLIALSAPASADLLLPNGKEIFDNHDNPAPGPCHPALQTGAWLKSGLRGWGPWSATSEMRTHELTPSDHETPITYSDPEDPPWSCEP